MPWPFSSGQCWEFRVEWVAELVVPGTPSGRSRTCPEGKVEKNGLDFVPECAGLIPAAGHTVGSSGQLSSGAPGALIREQRQCVRHHGDESKADGPGEALGLWAHLTHPRC